MEFFLAILQIVLPVFYYVAVQKDKETWVRTFFLHLSHDAASLSGIAPWISNIIKSLFLH